MSTRIFKQSNLLNQEEEEDDMISLLPDEILISIISLIPTKEALTTRVLSKRWRNLFHLIPALAFVRKCNFRCTCNSEDFINGVDQILQRHSASIHSFDLRCCLPESCISTQLSVVFTRLGNLGVQKLKFRPSYLPFFKPGYMKFPFPCHLLSLMKSLLHFKLSSCSLSNHPPRNNSLKTLRLSKVCCASQNSLESVLSNCVNLCSLTLKKCKLPSKLCFPRLVDLQLKCMVIHDCEGLKEIDVYAANLTTFGFNTNYMVNLIFIHVPKLQSVYLTSRQLHMSHYCGQLAKYSHHLKTLVLNDVGNLYQDGCIDVGKNMFGKLKRLELIVLTLNRLNLLSLALVLQGLSCLEEFHLSTMAPFHEWTEEEKHVIVESRSQLKLVEINGFGGDEIQIMFVEYILKSSARLEQMIISMYSSQYMGFGEWLVYGFPPCGCYGWSQVYECIERMKHKAVSKTLRVVAQKFPETKSKCL